MASVLTVEARTDAAGGETVRVSGQNTVVAHLSEGVEAVAIIDGDRVPLHLIPVWRQCDAFRQLRIEWSAKAGGAVLVKVAANVDAAVRV